MANISYFYPDAKNTKDERSRRIQMTRLIAKMPTIAAFSYRHSMGLPYVYPDNDLSYVGNFLAMIRKIGTTTYKVHPTLEKALDILFILHADHEQNCSTSAMRAIGSSHADPYVSLAGAAAALYGPLHGGANEQVLRMIEEIGHPKNVGGFIEDVKGGKGQRLMGFGHRVYKSYDPRARIVKQLADDVFRQVGMDKDLEIALELERIALEDEYFVSRKLYPNVDFYTGLIYRSMGFPTEFFTVLFAVARTAGWLAQWEEMLLDKEQKIARPRQIYVGSPERPYAGVEEFVEHAFYEEWAGQGQTQRFATDPAGNPLSPWHPWNKETIPKPDATSWKEKYSWSTAPRWDRLAMETGAYSRIWVAAQTGAANYRQSDFIHSTGSSLQIDLPKAALPNDPIEWRIPEVWGAFERNRARAYCVPFTAMIAFINWRLAMEELKLGHTETSTPFEIPRTGEQRRHHVLPQSVQRAVSEAARASGFCEVGEAQPSLNAIVASIESAR